MLTNETMVQVTNRGNSLVIYTIPELHIKRRFAIGEKKLVTVKEMRALYALRGGKALICEHLIIDNEELVNELIYNVQPEYYYSVDDIIELLLRGSEDQLLDAIDFGPEGVHDLIKKEAVELKLNDVNKRQIILEKLDFNVTSAIENNIFSNPTTGSEQGRRAAPINAASSAPVESAEPVRRTAPKYKVTTKVE